MRRCSHPVHHQKRQSGVCWCHGHSKETGLKLRRPSHHTMPQSILAALLQCPRRRLAEYCGVHRRAHTHACKHLHPSLAKAVRDISPILPPCSALWSLVVPTGTLQQLRKVHSPRSAESHSRSTAFCKAATSQNDNCAAPRH